MSYSIEDLNQSIKRSKAQIELGVSLARLQVNRDFQKIIQSGYLENEAVRLVHLKAAPEMQSAQDQERIVREIDAIGALPAYFRAIRHQAAQAAKSLVEDEETLEALTQEGEV